MSTQYELLFGPDAIATKVDELAKKINSSYGSIDIVYATNGATIFCSDLIRKLSIPARMLPLTYQNYPKPGPTGEIRVTLDIQESLYERDVILLDGMIISGRTPWYVYNMLKLRGPASLNVCALGAKPELLAVPMEIYHHCFTFKDEVVVGYGIGDGTEKAFSSLMNKNK